MRRVLARWQHLSVSNNVTSHVRYRERMSIDAYLQDEQQYSAKFNPDSKACGNEFSVGEAKIGEKQSRQSNSKYNFTQLVFFSKKGIRSVGYNRVWPKPQKPGNFQEFSC